MSAVFPIAADDRYRISTASDGQTAFSVPFPFIAIGDLEVWRTDLEGVRTRLVYPEDYSVTGAGNPAGGTVTLETECEAGELIERIGSAELTRVLSIVQGGRFDSQATDRDLDRLMIIAQELARDIGRGLKVDFGQEGPRVEVGAAGTVPMWNAAGELVEGPDADEIAAAQGYAEAAAASAGQASEHADDAEAAKEAAAAAAAAFPLESRFAAASFHPAAAPSFIRVEGYLSAGDGGGALYKRVLAEPTHAGKLSITLADGVILVWYEIADLVVSVRAFGAVGDGSDETLLVQAAINAVGDMGGGVLTFPRSASHYGAFDLLLRSNITFLGQGGTVGIPTGNTTKNAIIAHLVTPVENIRFDNMVFEGAWQSSKSELAANGLITIKKADGLYFDRCKLLNSRAFAFNINECDRVEVINCTLENACRDMIAVWGTPNVLISGNYLRGNNDDAISVNWETPHTEPVRSSIIITDNLLEDVGPIRTQAPKNILIRGNHIFRARGTGILVGVNNVSTNDISSAHNVLVEGNVISDVIDRQWFETGDQTGSVNNRIYISLLGLKPQAGGLAVPPGEIDPATGAVQSPYDYFYKKGGTSGGQGPLRRPQSIYIRNNICRRTLPAVANYSDWGYGEAYYKTGTIDYQVPNTILRGIGMRIQVPVRELVIEHNAISTGYSGVRFALATGVSNADNLLSGVSIRGNHFTDFTFGLECDLGGTTLRHHEVDVDENEFDGDPFFTNSSRGANGTWANGGSCVAIYTLYMGGINARRNKFKNVGSPRVQTGSSGHQLYADNIIVCDPAAANFSTSNKGCGTIPPIGAGDEFWLDVRDCDPTSGTYNQSLGACTRNVVAMPSAGKWLAGMRVNNRGTPSGGKVLVHYVRLTTGSAHVLNTDWSPVYGTTS